MSKLCDALIAGWHATATRAQQEYGRGEPEVQAYLLLDSWKDNVLADSIQSHYPALAQSRCVVADAHFKHRADEAPCLVCLPRALGLSVGIDTVAANEARDHLTHWLTHAWRETNQRLARQSFSGVVLATADAPDIAQHWVHLGHQSPPDGATSRLFRYQDARVMQRVWLDLAPSQRMQWLGPVIQWWALPQPWESWSFEAMTNSGGETLSVDQIKWFCADTSEYEKRGDQDSASTRSIRALFDRSQWHAAHSAPSANRLWARYADNQVSAHDQPNGEAMTRLLADGYRLGLTSTNLEDYVWCTWRIAPDDGPRERPWHSPRGTAILTHILGALSRQPQSRFASLYAEALSH